MSNEGFVETYRGAVAANECDAFGHMNIAFYPARFAAAAADCLERAGEDAALWRTVALDVQYLAELRAAAGIVIRSAVLGVEGRRARLAHEALTPSGARTTLVEHVLERADGASALHATAIAWDSMKPVAWPASEGAIASGRNRVRAIEAEGGVLSLDGLVHFFSDACLFVIEAVGMSEEYRRREGRGYATFDTRLAIEGALPRVGEGVTIASGIVSVGNSSLVMAHRLRAASDGRPLARFWQAGVHFDLSARRSAPWPQSIRDAASGLRFPTQ